MMSESMHTDYGSLDSSLRSYFYYGYIFIFRVSKNIHTDYDSLDYGYTTYIFGMPENIHT